LDIETLIQSNWEGSGDRYFACPSCQDDHRNKTKKCLHVTYDDGFALYYCYRCLAKGKHHGDTFMSKEIKTTMKQTIGMVSKRILNSDDMDWLKTRGIGDLVTNHSDGEIPLAAGEPYFGDLEKSKPAIGFIYPGGAVKWRAKEERAWTSEGAARSFFLLDSVTADPETIVITEGEIDALSVMSAGIKNVLSVPNGANLSKDKSGSYKVPSYVKGAERILKSAKEIILATDADEKGDELREGLISILGRSKVRIARYPSKCKDANDVLTQHGVEILRECIEGAERPKIRGIVRPKDIRRDIDGIRKDGFAEGARIGIGSIDKLMTLLPGQLSVVTGVPGSGKSEWVDHVMYSLAERHGWKFMVFSAENPIPLHVGKLAEKRIGKSMLMNGSATDEEYDAGIQWVDDHFRFADASVDSSIGSIFERADACIDEQHIDGIVIDPYNYIGLPGDVTETLQISSLLTELHRYAMRRQVHVWIVAHPQKMYRSAGGSIPDVGPYDISGSANWFNKADFGQTVSRLEDGTTRVNVWKCRFKWLGSTGSAFIRWDSESGRFSDSADYAAEVLGDVDWDDIKSKKESSNEELPNEELF
jgi:twinkle protein